MKRLAGYATIVMGLTLLAGISLAQNTTTTIAKDEKAALTLMREEERLAHDVYTALYKKWNMRIFNNIAQSEQRHTDAVLGLIKKFGLEDPAKDKKEGEFSNKVLQKLYDDLVKEGSKSLVDALKVGARVEELDIFDLRNLSKKVKNSDIQKVFENLERGSRNHLRSFNRQITSRNESYKPKHLSQAEYNKIINSPMERGGGG